MQYKKAPEVKKQIKALVKQLNLDHIKLKNIHCIRSTDAKTRAYARIWGMAKLFKEVVGIEPHYIIEVNARRADKNPDSRTDAHPQDLFRCTSPPSWQISSDR